MTNAIETTSHIETDDQMDVRDLIARFEELEIELQDSMPDENCFHTYVENMAENENGVLHNAAQEYAELKNVLNDLQGNGGDEQWRGDWYPVGLIRDSYFSTAMDDMLEDCGDLPKDLPCYLTITVDYKALQMDYTSVEIGGDTFWYR